MTVSRFNTNNSYVTIKGENQTEGFFDLSVLALDSKENSIECLKRHSDDLAKDLEDRFQRLLRYQSAIQILENEAL